MTTVNVERDANIFSIVESLPFASDDDVRALAEMVGRPAFSDEVVPTREQIVRRVNLVCLVEVLPMLGGEWIKILNHAAHHWAGKVETNEPAVTPDNHKGGQSVAEHTTNENGSKGAGVMTTAGPRRQSGVDDATESLNAFNRTIEETLKQIRAASQSGGGEPPSHRCEVLGLDDVAQHDLDMHRAVDWDWLAEQVVRGRKVVRLPFAGWGNFDKEQWAMCIREQLGACNMGWYTTDDAVMVVPRHTAGVDVSNIAPGLNSFDFEG